MAKAWVMVTSVSSDFLQVGKLGVMSPMGRRMLRTGIIHPGFRGKERVWRQTPWPPQGATNPQVAEKDWSFPPRILLFLPRQAL